MILSIFGWRILNWARGRGNVSLVEPKLEVMPVEGRFGNDLQRQEQCRQENAMRAFENC
jgi:hypothetical protein